MGMDPVLARFVEDSPVTVMARLLLERTLPASWVDEVFTANAKSQYTKELLFSEVVDLMSLVSLGLRPNLHAAAKKSNLSVSMTALYDKVNRVELPVTQALVRGAATRLTPIMSLLRKDRILDGYTLRIIDGNCLPPSEKRLAPLRDLRGTVLPGKSLVVYDPDLDLVTDVVLNEDGHAGEQPMVNSLLEAGKPDELWMGDCAFSTRELLLLGRRTNVLFREHPAHPNATPVGPRREIGRCDTGMVFEQEVTIPDGEGGTHSLRRIEIELDTPTEDGVTVVRLLTNLPKSVKAKKVAKLYLKRWTIERMFGRLESALNSEINTLAYPAAALFAFGLATVSYNVLAAVEAAVENAHELEEEDELSTYHVAEEVKATMRGLDIAVAASVWVQYAKQSTSEFAATLLSLGSSVKPKSFQKAVRGPKKEKPKGRVSVKEASRQSATARLLKKRQDS
jgi:hypothetical protein